MKRAAGQIRKVRRNNKGDKDGDYSSNDPEHAPQQQPVRRKPTPEEAALTAKNYRLAKELSDLRVRHREECKATSRLTMDNMNLATRWRDAVSQLSVLKKELALQQRKAAEAIAQQQKAQQQQPSSSQMVTYDSPSSLRQPRTQQMASASKSSSSVSSSALVEKSPVAPSSAARGGNSLQDVAAEMDLMDRILAAHQSQSNKQIQNNQSDAAIPSATIVPSPSNNSRHSLGSTSVADDDNNFEEKKSQSMDQPVTPSPEKEDNSFGSNNSNDNDKNDEEQEEDFFARFKGSTTRVDLDDTLDDIDDVDDPDLSPPSVTPSESPPPTPPQSQSPTSQPDNFDNLASIASSEGSMQDALVDTSSPLFPMTASPKLVPKSKVYNEEFPPDITSQVTRHPRSAERRAMAEFNDIDEEEDSSPGTTSTMTTSNAAAAAAVVKPPSLSSIDAFEASFATKFPESFSPGDERFDTDSTNGGGEEEYNPFFPTSPTKYDENETLGSSPHHSASPMSSNSRGSIRRGQTDSALSPVNSGRHRPSSPTRTPTQRCSLSSNDGDNDNNIGITDSPPTGGTISKRGARYETPPHGYKSPEVILSDGPKRPEKSGAAAARARYEKALQPRGFQVGGARRFPRRAERETDHGTSPVNASSTRTTLSSSSPSMLTNNNQREENNGVQVDSSKLAMAQARVKERTAAFSGRTSLSTLESKMYSSIRENNNNKWTPQPSPADSVGSKPWDEEIGDIPMGPSSANRSATAPAPVNGTFSGQNGVYSAASFSRSSPASGPMRPSSYTRHRPWDTANNAPSNNDQEGFSATNATVSSMSINTNDFSSALGNQGEDTPSSMSSNGDDEDCLAARYMAGKKSRRSVKQPISYAEPSLSAKLRRGDVFFPKVVEPEDPTRNRPPPSNPVHL